ncbi:MAG: DoxX family membrane protein [Burkholderiales bacterium]
MFQEHTALQAAGQLLLAFAFLASGARNAFWTFRQHEERMAALGVPCARWVLIGGFALLFPGALLLLFDYQRAMGAWLLIAFTILASAIFHRWWLLKDPLLRHLHIGNLLVNAGVVGGLLLVAAT